MSPHPLNTPHILRGRLSFASLRKLALMGGMAGYLGMAPAAEPTPPASAAPSLPDVVLARSALTALDAEAELKGVNLVVSVVNGVAVIGGPVPSAAIAKRAEQIVRKVEGMKEVRNTCFVSSGPDPLLKAIAEKTGSLPPRPIMGELPAILGNPSTPPMSPFPQGGKVVIGNADSTVVARKPALSSSGAAGLLGAPVGPAEPNTSSPVIPPASAAAPGQLTGSTAGGVLAAANEMKRTEARFANLTIELRDGTLVVGGSAPLASDGWDFAKKIQHVPGVSRVVVGTVAGK